MRPPVVAADVTRTVLGNGVTCLVKALPGSGAVAVHGYVKAGGIFDGNRPGLARFVSSSLIRGTARRTGPQLAEDLDAMGASLSISSGIEVVGVTSRSLAGDVGALLGLVAEVLTLPAFAPGEIENVRGELVTSVRVNAMDTRQVAERIFRRLAYPEGHPHSQSPDGDEETLSTLAPGDLHTFHTRHFTADAAIIAVVGDAESASVVDLVAESFGSWSGQDRWHMPQVPAAVTPPAVRRERAVLPGKTQSDLVLGIPGVARADPAYYAVMMANLFLGQLGMMGRIGQNVREKQGMAYYAFSDLRAGLLAGPWWVRAGVNPANVDRAVSAVLHEVAELQTNGPAADELADARTYLTGSLAVRLETSQGIAQMLADMELFGLGLDYLERYPTIIGGTSRDAIVHAIRRFPTEAYVLAVAGPDGQG